MAHPLESGISANVTSAEYLVRSYYRLVDSGDMALLDLFHLEAEYKRPGYQLMVGKAALSDFYRRIRVIKQGSHTIQSLFVRGSQVAVEGVFTGILKSNVGVSVPFSDFFDLEVTGKSPMIRSRRTYFGDESV